MLASFSSEPRQKDKEYFTSANFEELNSIIETVLASTGCDDDTSGTIRLKSTTSTNSLNI